MERTIKITKVSYNTYCPLKVFVDGEECTLERVSNLMTETDECEGLGIFSEGSKIEFKKGTYVKIFSFEEDLLIGTHTLRTIARIIEKRALQVRAWSRDINENSIEFKWVCSD